MTVPTRTGGRARRLAVALAVACHPLPTVAVTLFAVAMAGAAGVAVGTQALLAAAVLTGQLSVGWGNDAQDAGLDSAAARTDKPVARGDIAAGTLRLLAVAAAGACVPLSLALGLWPGSLHLLAVGSAWAYNLWLKSTALSVVPYAVSFGLAPVIAVGCLPGSPRPVPAVVVAAALLGSGAHFSNSLGDVAADQATGVRGLPQRLGPRRSAVASATLVAAAAAVFVPVTEGDPVALAGGLVALGLGTAGLVRGLRGVAAGDRTPFRLTIAASAALVLSILLSGSAFVAS